MSAPDLAWARMRERARLDLDELLAAQRVQDAPEGSSASPWMRSLGDVGDVVVLRGDNGWHRACRIVGVTGSEGPGFTREYRLREITMGVGHGEGQDGQGQGSDRGVGDDAEEGQEADVRQEEVAIPGRDCFLGDRFGNADITDAIESGQGPGGELID